MQKSLKKLENSYAGTPRKDWAESDRSELAQLTAELNGLRSSYNDLTAQHNAARWQRLIMPSPTLDSYRREQKNPYRANSNHTYINQKNHDYSEKSGLRDVN